MYSSEDDDAEHAVWVHLNRSGTNTHIIVKRNLNLNLHVNAIVIIDVGRDIVLMLTEAPTCTY